MRHRDFETRYHKNQRWLHVTEGIYLRPGQQDGKLGAGGGGDFGGKGNQQDQKFHWSHLLSSYHQQVWGWLDFLNAYIYSICATKHGLRYQ